MKTKKPLFPPFRSADDQAPSRKRPSERAIASTTRLLQPGYIPTKEDLADVREVGDYIKGLPVDRLLRHPILTDKEGKYPPAMKRQAKALVAEILAEIEALGHFFGAASAQSQSRAFHEAEKVLAHVRRERARGAISPDLAEAEATALAILQRRQ